MATRYNCDGSGRRATPTGSTAFPEVKCPLCHFYASPIKRYGDWQIRAHRPVKTEPEPMPVYQGDGTYRDPEPIECEHGYTSDCPNCDVPSYLPEVELSR